MRKLIWRMALAGGLVAIGSHAFAQTCDPVCAAQPKECCAVQPPVASETLETPSGRCLSNGVVLHAQDGFFPSSPFQVSINQGTLVGTFTVAPDGHARFVTSDGGKCAGADVSPLPSSPEVIIDGQVVKLAKKAFVCTTPDVTQDLICFQVRGRSPLPVPAICAGASRVTDVCVIATVL